MFRKVTTLLAHAAAIFWAFCMGYYLIRHPGMPEYEQLMGVGVAVLLCRSTWREDRGRENP